jgi:tRNA 2-thiouridine synthesizing protein A
MPPRGGGCLQEFSNEIQAMAEKILDTTGLLCPLPILKAKKALGDVSTGGTLEVLATDPGSAADFEAFCRATGNTLLEQSLSAGVFRFLILKRA